MKRLLVIWRNRPAMNLAGELQLDSRGMFIRRQFTESQSYRVEYRDDVTDPARVPFGIDVLGAGDVMAVRVPKTAYPQRSYRLRAEE
jgi:hypothetical protein